MFVVPIIINFALGANWIKPRDEKIKKRKNILNPYPGILEIRI